MEDGEDLEDDACTGVPFSETVVWRPEVQGLIQGAQGLRPLPCNRPEVPGMLSIVKRLH